MVTKISEHPGRFYHVVQIFVVMFLAPVDSAALVVVFTLGEALLVRPVLEAEKAQLPSLQLGHLLLRGQTSKLLAPEQHVAFCAALAGHPAGLACHR